jgi:mRNA-degrading endonuclease RelE of RelBE toxin-antitoxin system
MTPYKIRVADGYLKGLKKLPPDRQKGANKSLVLFQTEPQLHRLKFRQLKGQEYHYIINGKGGDRIILLKESADTFVALDVGPHDIYRKWDRR